MNFWCYEIMLSIKTLQSSPEHLKKFNCLYKAGRAVKPSRVELKSGDKSGIVIVTDECSLKVLVIPDKI